MKLIAMKISMIGKTFGRWKVIEEADPVRSANGRSVRAFLCICECGNQKIVRGYQLRRGSSSSCGCLRREWAAALQSDGESD